MTLQRECNQQTCNVCGRKDCFNFHLPDWLWRSVLPEWLWQKVVCLCCFDEFAKVKNIDYAQYLDVLYFAGQQASLTLHVASAS